MIDQAGWYALVAVLLFGIGLHGVIVRRDAIRKILSINIMAAGVFLLLVSLAKRDALDFPDPVPHAMALTGIVIAISATAFALALAGRIAEAESTSESDDEGDA